jgi:hypothetical protein
MEGEKMDCLNCPLSELCFKVPTEGKVTVPLEKVYDIIVENLLAVGVIVEQEAATYRGMLIQMKPQQLIETLLESHISREKLRAQSN